MSAEIGKTHGRPGRLAFIKGQDGQGHDLPSFARYLNKVFGFRQAVAKLTDSRDKPKISPASVFLSVFHAFVFRLRSFQQLERELGQPGLQRWVGAPRAFSDDVFRYSLCGFQLSGLEQMMVDMNRKLKRNKAFDKDRVQGRIVAAVDGIEVLSSYSRCCDHCLERKVKVKKAGVKVEQTQYYHRAVGCQIISGPVKTILAFEWLQPGEGEDTAALRLLNKLPQMYGSRMFDILVLDALYAQSPVLKLAADKGWDVVISLKQNNRELYQSAIRLFAHRGPDVRDEEQHKGKKYCFQIWDTTGLPFAIHDTTPVRVIRSEESVTQNHWREKKRQPETTEHEWVWLTTLNQQAFPPAVVRRIGHDRWKQENNGWDDLTQNWAFKHGFLHACCHRPRTQSGDGGPRVPVDNRGLPVVCLIALLAFNFSSAFMHCHSKLFRLYAMPAIEVARQLQRSVSDLPPRIRAPDCPAPAV